MAAYLTQTDLENAMTASRVLAAYQDDNETLNAAALASVLQRSSDLVDGAIFRSYTGTAPMPSPPPVLAREAALLYAMALTIERIPEYGARYGEKHTLDLRAAADKMCEKIAVGLLKLVDAPPPTATVALTGGIVTTSSPMLTVVDGVNNTGDF